MKDRNIALVAVGIVLVGCVCCAVLLVVGSIYGLSVLVDWYNQMSEWAAQGNTCDVTAFVPLGIGLVLWRSRGKR